MKKNLKLSTQISLFTFTVAMITISLNANAQTIYKIVQEDGTVIYTDQALPGAIPVDLSGVRFSSVPRLATPAQTLSSPNNSNNIKYEVQVLSPSPEATIRNNAGQMSISASLSSPLNNSQYHLYLDNTKVASQNDGTFVLDGINRGAHTFYISVTDNRGKTLASSETQTFYMQQVSILTNPGSVN